MSGLLAERDAAFAAAEQAAATHRLAVATIRDGMLTPAESEARTAAFVECLDAES